jgi:hypothetical protein
MGEAVGGKEEASDTRLLGANLEITYWNPSRASLGRYFYIGGKMYRPDTLPAIACLRYMATRGHSSCTLA